MGTTGRRDAATVLGVAGVAVATAWLGWENGGVGLSQVAGSAIVLGAGLAAAGAGVQVTRWSLIACALLAGYVGETLVSAVWAPSAEAAVADFDRVMLYLVLFCAAAWLPWPSRRALGDGLALGLTAVVVIALVQRLAPGLLSDRGLASAVPSARARLSFPIGYWNGLGAVAAMAIPLLGGVALRHRLRGAVAVGLMPLCGAALYLTSSRGAIGAAVIGCAVLVLSTRARLRATAILGLGGASSAAAILFLARQRSLVDGLGTAQAAAEGHRGALALGLCGAAAAGLFWLVAPSSGRRLPAPAGRLAFGAIVVPVFLGLAFVDVPGRVRAFKALPSSPSGSGFTTAHLLASAGSGRWQFWHAAVEQFAAHPVLGGGSGSFGEWWNRHAAFAYVVHDAHSLYIETLGELGITGFLLLVSFLVVVLGCGVRAVLRDAHGESVTVAPLLAAFVVWCVAAGLDWLWELPAVSAPAVVVAGAIARRDRDNATRGRLGTTGQSLLALAVFALIALEVLPLLASLRLRESRTAAARGELVTAASLAQSAHAVAPWAASPHLQASLVAEAGGHLGTAIDEIRRAQRLDTGDWRLWLIQARLETEIGNVVAAQASLARAEALDPLNPVLGH